jgi:hypothetical protein
MPSSNPPPEGAAGMTVASRCLSWMSVARRESMSRRPGSIFWTLLEDGDGLRREAILGELVRQGQQDRDRLPGLARGDEHVRELQPQPRIVALGQELLADDLDGPAVVLLGDEGPDVLAFARPAEPPQRHLWSDLLAHGRVTPVPGEITVPGHPCQKEAGRSRLRRMAAVMRWRTVE